MVANKELNRRGNKNKDEKYNEKNYGLVTSGAIRGIYTVNSNIRIFIFIAYCVHHVFLRSSDIWGTCYHF